MEIKIFIQWSIKIPTGLSLHQYANECIFIAFNLSFSDELVKLWNHCQLFYNSTRYNLLILLFQNSFLVYVLNHFHHEILIFYLYKGIFNKKKQKNEKARKKESSNFCCASISNEYKQRKKLFCFLILNMNIVQTFVLLRKTLAVC